MYLRKIPKGYLYTPNESQRYTRNMCIVPPKYHQDMSKIFVKYLRARSKPLYSLLSDGSELRGGIRSKGLPLWMGENKCEFELILYMV